MDGVKVIHRGRHAIPAAGPRQSLQAHRPRRYGLLGGHRPDARPHPAHRLAAKAHGSWTVATLVESRELRAPESIAKWGIGGSQVSVAARLFDGVPAGYEGFLPGGTWSRANHWPIARYGFE